MMKNQTTTASQDLTPPGLVLRAGTGVVEVDLRGDPEPTDTGNTVGMLWLLWKERTFLFRAVCIGIVLSVVIAFLLPKRYTSTTRLMPPDHATGSGMEMLAALAGKGGPSLGALGGQLLGGMKTTGDLFVGILQSRTVKDDLISKFDLKKVYGTSRIENAREILGHQTAISQDRKSGIITIDVNDRSPERAANIAQQYVVELNQVVTGLNTSSAHKERVFLQERLDEVKQGLESAEKDFSQFASKNTALDIQEEGKAMLQASAALEGQIIAIQTELQGLRQLYTDNNIRVRATQARLNELQRQLQKISGDPDTPTGKQAADPASSYPSMRQLPLLGVSYADLYRRMKVQEVVFDTLTQQYELARVEEAKETPSVQVLDPADVPEQKSYPQRWIVVLAGMLLSLTFGVAWILGNHHWGVLDPTDPRKALAQEVFHSAKAMIPWAHKNGFRSGGGNGTH
jgi:capsule polysaccharide export protein KpsE/RkpR